MSWSASVLTTVSADTEPCIILTFDNAKYLFNAGENTGRSFLQSRRNWRKTKGIFFTDVGSHRMGGLPGLLMTFADATIDQLSVHGPTGILHYMASMRLYTYRDKLSVSPHEISMNASLAAASMPVFKDEHITVYALPVLPSTMDAPIVATETQATPMSKKRKHEGVVAPLAERMNHGKLTPSQLTGDMADEWRRLVIKTMFPAPEKDTKPKQSVSRNSKRAKPSSSADAPMPTMVEVSNRRERPHPGFYTQLPKLSLPHPPRDADPTLTPALCYVVFGPRTRGQFNKEKAEELRIPNNGLRGQLTRGETVTFTVTENGSTFERTVRSEDVVAPPEPAHAVVFLEVPSTSHIMSLFKSFEDSTFYNSLLGAPSAEHNVRCVFHTLGPGVLEDSRYVSFMSRFHAGCHHIIASKEHCLDPVTFTSAAFQQLRMQSLDPGIFAVPKYVLGCDKDFRTIPGMPPNAELMTASTVVQVRPATGLVIQDREVIEFDTFHPLVRGERVLELTPQTMKAFEEAKESVRKLEEEEKNALQIPGADVGVIPLGTGSAIPSKYRNVSSTLIRIPGYGHLLLDAGEGTWGQLARMYGTDLKDPANAWNVLRDLRCVFASHIHGDHHMGIAMLLRKRRTLHPPPAHPLYLVAIRSVHLYLREVSEVQNIGLDDETSGNGVVQIMSEALHWKNPKAYPEYGAWRVVGQENWTDIHESKFRAQKLCEALNLKLLRTIDVRHRTVCYGLHLKSNDGWSIVFSADTIPADALVYAGQGATLLIHEASMADDQEELAAAKSHSTHGQAVQIGKRMNANIILLNHFSARYPKLPSFSINVNEKEEDDKQTVIVHAFDHANLTIGNMWKLKYYLGAVVKSLKDTEDEEEDEKEDEMVLNDAAVDV